MSHSGMVPVRISRISYPNVAEKHVTDSDYILLPPKKSLVIDNNLCKKFAVALVRIDASSHSESGTTFVTLSNPYSVSTIGEIYSVFCRFFVVFDDELDELGLWFGSSDDGAGLNVLDVD